MKIDHTDCDCEFTEAEKYWHLGKLYGDLAQFKGRSLANRETQWLRALLLGYTCKDICSILYGANNSDTLRPGLAKYLYPLIGDLIRDRTQQEPGKITGVVVLVQLEKLGYRKALMSED